MASNDSNRYRKTYSFFRAPPANNDVTIVSGGYGINVEGTQREIIISVDTSVISGSGGGGTVNPLPTVFFVDPNQTVASPDGSISKPFQTAQAALDSFSVVSPVPSTWTIMIAPGTSAGSLSIPASLAVSNLDIVGLNAAQIGQAGLDSVTLGDGLGSALSFQNIQITTLFSASAATSIPIWLTNCSIIGDISASQCALILERCDTFANVVAGSISAFITDFSGPILAADSLLVDGTTYYFMKTAGLATVPTEIMEYPHVPLVQQGVTASFGTIGAGASTTATATIAGLLASLPVAVSPEAALPTGIVYQAAWCASLNTLSVQLYNATVSPVAVNTLTFDVMQGQKTS